jgi:hypothetical protein
VLRDASIQPVARRRQRPLKCPNLNEASIPFSLFQVPELSRPHLKLFFLVFPMQEELRYDTNDYGLPS